MSRFPPPYPVLDRSDPLARGLFLDVPFWENSGDKVRDLVHNNTGVLNGSLSLRRGVGEIGNFVTFPGTGDTDVIRVPTHATIDNLRALTFNLWIRFASFRSTNVGISGRVAIGNSASWVFEYGGGSSVDWRIQYSGTSFQTNVAGLSTGLWYMLTGTVSTTGFVSFYVNADLGDTNDAGNSGAIIDGNDHQVVIGGKTTGGGTSVLDGDIAKAQAWRRALPHGEILDLYYDPHRLHKPVYTVISVPSAVATIADYRYPVRGVM